MPSSRRRKKKAAAALAAKRESGFDLSCTSERLPDYNALYDGNLRHYFENRRIQSHLFSSGLIDQEGRVIDTEKNASKLAIIESEFKNAEKQEFWRTKEELEMRRRVQKKRHEALDISRRTERMLKQKDDRRIAQEILRAGRDAVSIPAPRTRRKKSSSKRRPVDSEQGSFFLTSAGGMSSAGTAYGTAVSMSAPNLHAVPGATPDSSGFGDASMLIGA